ncbi:hypothetical protein MBLNU459_g5981t2 [Dothideomycetes sp. NU459]
MANILLSHVSAGIGLVSEGVSAYKAKKNGNNNDERTNPDQVEVVIDNHEDEQWTLDEAQDELVGGLAPEQGADARDLVHLADTFVRNYPPSQNGSTATRRLSLPVVLPQRRPKDRSRGFVRAYAPVLQECDIDQAMFIDFLETFNKASRNSPWLAAINLASIGTFFLPSGIAIAVSIAIQAASLAAIEVQTRSRTNSFLDKINDEFYRPRGLFCLVMTWDPESSSTQTSVNFASTISKSIRTTSSGNIGRKLMHNLKGSSGSTSGDMPFPETAPLVFPGLDTLAARSDEESMQTKGKLKQGQAFVADYMDRRAQAKFGPKPEFASRFADPNHAANSGSLLAMVSGGKLDVGQRGGIARGRVLGSPLRSLSSSSLGSPLGSPLGRSGSTFGSSAGPLSGMQKVFKKNVLYLMIVNMPTEEEMAEASRILKKSTSRS